MTALLIDLGWKSALICGMALMLGHMLRHRAAIERVTLLRITAATLLALPLLALIIPAIEIDVLPAPDAAPTTLSAIPHVDHGAGVPIEAPGVSPIDAALILYGAGAGFVLLRLLAGLLMLRRWTRTALPASDPQWLAVTARATATLRRPVRLLVSPCVSAPLSWGASPGWILIGPATHERPEQAEAVIAHEMAHIRRLDWPMLVASRIAVALFWFNPLAWLVDRELARQAELAADEEAVRHVAQADYAQTLLTVGRMAAHPVACGMAAPRTVLATRIGRVLQGTPRPPANRLLCTVLLIGASGAIAPLAAAKLVSAPIVDRMAPLQRVQREPPRIVRVARAADRTSTTTLPTEPRAVARTAALTSPAPKPAAAQPPIRQAESEAITPVSAPTTVPVSVSVPMMRHAAVTQVDDAAERRRAERQGQAIIVAGRREFARGLSDSANDMRQEAKTLEGAAAGDRLPPKDREQHLRMARSLRVQAEQLDAEARRLILEPRP